MEMQSPQPNLLNKLYISWNLPFLSHTSKLSLSLSLSKKGVSFTHCWLASCKKAMKLSWNLFLFTLQLFTVVLAAAETGGDIQGDEESRRREADRVTELPEQPPVSFRQYAGYVELGPGEGQALFYWFFEAQDDVAHKPLVLWLNGGPGCSSIAFGAAQELGPFLVQSNGQLKLNSFSWNKVANMLFLETPVGVGFSYTNKSSDLGKLGDGITAQYSHAFLLGWFKRFPSFKLHDFYIAGESYAGHYAPQLAELIYERNKNSSKDLIINFKGFLIGNAAINDATDSKGMVDFAWTHAIISDQLHTNIIKECNFSAEDQPVSCISNYRDFLVAYSKIDVYNIYEPTCLSSSSSSSFESTFQRLINFAPRFLAKDKLWNRLPTGYDPCTVNYAIKYFNREDVQRALHANITQLSYPYTPCSSVIRAWNDAPSSILPIIHKFLLAGSRIWIFSGDTDGRIPITSTRSSINEMNLKIEEEWRPWYHNHQVAGWVETYKEGLTLATVRGAGHQVPIFAPHQALSLITHFLSGKSLPNSTKS